ncbi:MAG: homoprotocatechuate degradation operon regulator HpaR [Pseudomonadota bacterium]
MEKAHRRAPAVPTQTRRSIPIALLRAREQVMSRFRPMLAVHGVTEQQWRVLRVVAESEAIDASELAQRACILAPSLTRIAKHLEDGGLIMRVKDAQDARRARFDIAPDGLALIDAMAADREAIYASIEAEFGHERMETLLELLEQLAEL